MAVAETRGSGPQPGVERSDLCSSRQDATNRVTAIRETARTLSRPSGGNSSRPRLAGSILQVPRPGRSLHRRNSGLSASQSGSLPAWLVHRSVSPRERLIAGSDLGLRGGWADPSAAARLNTERLLRQGVQLEDGSPVLTEPSLQEPLTAEQGRVARKLLCWSQRQLSDACRRLQPRLLSRKVWLDGPRRRANRRPSGLQGCSEWVQLQRKEDD